MGYVKINVYKTGGRWYAAIWVDDVFDSVDQLDVDPDVSEFEATEEARTMFLSVTGPRTIRVVNEY